MTSVKDGVKLGAGMLLFKLGMGIVLAMMAFGACATCAAIGARTPEWQQKYVN